MDTLATDLPASAGARRTPLPPTERRVGEGGDATKPVGDASRDRGVPATRAPASGEAVAALAGAVDAGQRHAAPFRSVDFAAGEADGIRCRTDRGRPSKYLLVGRDDYAAGFRAGYFRVAAPRTAGATLPQGALRRDRHAAIVSSDPTRHRRPGSVAEHASPSPDGPDAV